LVLNITRPLWAKRGVHPGQLDLSDRGYALELGRNRFADPGAALLANEDVRRIYYFGGA
jgi:ABC-type branched-subunit amino acid transport system ATPase component